jgi:hypothetical protein
MRVIIRSKKPGARPLIRKFSFNLFLPYALPKSSNLSRRDDAHFPPRGLKCHHPARNTYHHP